MENKSFITKISIPVYVIALILICADFFIINEFDIESNYFLSMVCALIFNIVIKIHPTWKHEFSSAVIANVLLSAITLTAVPFMFVYGFGYLFMIGHFPFIFILAAIVNFLLLIVAAEDVVNLVIMKKNNE